MWPKNSKKNKNFAEEIGLKLVSKRLALWRGVLEKTNAQIEVLRNEIEINEQIKIAAEKIIAEEKEKEK